MGLLCSAKSLFWLLILSVLITSCAQPAASAMEAKSDLERASSPQVQGADLQELTAGNSAFAFDLYHQLKKGGGNLFYSPYSISLALAMTYAGARGETEQQMAQTLHYLLPQDRLHPAFNALDLELARLDEGIGDEMGEPFKLNIANSIWGQRGYEFLSDYLDVIALNYGAGMRLVDFEKESEQARQVINDWVSEQTEEKIKDLIPQGAINTLTRLILANAIYFNAGWLHPFEVEGTREGVFHLLDGSDVAASFMFQEEMFRYGEGEGYQAVVLPYVGDKTAMVILLPDADRFESFEDSLDSQRLQEIMGSLESQTVRLSMPKFEYETSYGLSETLREMGMPRAFSEADFSGMDGTRDLFISEIVHKAFVSVDEEGTEAAAATAVIMQVTMAPLAPVEMTIDHPFIFMIEDLQTGTILFLGRVMNPVQ